MDLVSFKCGFPNSGKSQKFFLIISLFGKQHFEKTKSRHMIVI